MIKRVTILSLLLIFCSSSYSQSLEDGLVGWWPFNANAKDEASNVNDGKVYNAKLAKDRFGNDSSAYYFDGDKDYIDCGTHSSIRSSTHTVSFWFRYTDTTQNFFVVNCQSGKDGEWGSNCFHTPKDGWRFSASSGTNNHDIGHKTDKHLADDKWHLFTASYEKGSNLMTVYLDGCLSGYQNLTGSSGGFTSNDSLTYKSGVPWIFGASSYFYSASASYGPKYYKGYLDDVRIYNRPLSSVEVKGLFLEGTKFIVYDTIYTSVTDTLYMNVAWSSVSTNFNVARVYPNPTSDKIKVDFGDYMKLSGHKLVVNDMNGKEVYKSNVNARIMEINAKSFGGAGTYILVILDSNANPVATKHLILK